jgi:protein-disulfide isomerase
MAKVGSQEAALQARRKRRLMWVTGIVLAAITAVAIVIAVSSGGGGSKSSSSTTASDGTAGLKGVAAVTSEFKGIPQSGNVLGSPNAPATLMVFADLQCPFCAQWDNGALPSIVQKYVRPGKLKIVFQPIVIIGQDSVLGARAAAAAGQQGKLFEYAGLVYRNQGQENSGYLNNDYVKKIGSAVPGLDVAKLTADLKSAPVNKLLNGAQSLATSGRVNSTPTFFIAKSGQPLQPLQNSGLGASAFYPALDKLTG